MKVTHVSIIPTEAAAEAGRAGLTPELLAASGARYSRNNEGLSAILSKINFGNEAEVNHQIADLLSCHIDCDADAKTTIQRLQDLNKNKVSAELDKGVDSIFKMIDYGHQSIADMAPVAMFMDDISIYLAYYIWTLCPVAGGQESSTRYIKLDLEGVIESDDIGFRNVFTEEYKDLIEKSFSAYHKALEFWEKISLIRPELMRIPSELLEDTSEKAKKQVARMRRNYAFDRARVFLPVAAKTNVMMVQSARQWVYLSSHLQSCPQQEFQLLGELIRDELALVTPRLTKHARYSESTAKVLEDERKKLGEYVRNNPFTCQREGESSVSAEPTAWLESFSRDNMLAPNYIDSLKHRTNRYSLIGSSLSNAVVRFGWEAVALAEIRDFNRHRTGTKYCPLVPVGFYGAEDQVPEDMLDALVELRNLLIIGEIALYRGRIGLANEDPNYMYWTLLGNQYPYEHVTTADKYIYQAELRTGVGSHYRYAKHMRETLEIFYEQFPGTKGVIFEGSAEPE
jgi:thymidylate synthase ThyX